MKVAIVGLGYWGPNLARNLNQLGVLSMAFDIKDEVLEKFRSDVVYNNVKFSKHWEIMLDKTDVEGVVISTPPDTHYDIAKTCLANGKHVFIEKPMTLDVKDAEELVKLAKEVDRIIMVGHTFLYSPDIRKTKELVESVEFGDIYYMYTKRLNLGKIQRPANVIEDLAPHDISIFNYITGKKCIAVQSFGSSYILGDSEDISFINLKYENGIIANLHLSWLDPLKIRETVVVGSHQMIYCDSGDKEIHVYNKGVDVQKRLDEMEKSYATHLLNYRYGDEIVPYFDSYEPLRKEMEEFISCIKSGDQPLSNGDCGVEVVKTLSAAQKSLKEGGTWITL